MPGGGLRRFSRPLDPKPLTSTQEQSMSSRSSAVMVCIAAALVAALAVLSFQASTTLEEKTISVVSKERITKISKDSSTIESYVYSPDETYVVEDSFWNGHFTAMTVYATLKEGAECRVTLSGWRVGFLSMFQNIIKAECP
jgi:hypothetical protein